MKFSPIITALISPFYNYNLDKKSFFNLLAFQVEEGIDTFVLNGTTGESPTLEENEVKKICLWFQEFKKENGLDLNFILGTGSFSTKVSEEKTKKAEDLGAKAVLVVSPYYNKPNQAGMEKHFEKIAKTTSLPIILYNVPSRTGSSLSLEVIKNLSQISNIVGIKEATGDMNFFKQIRKNCNENFILFSGDDMTCEESFYLGGAGVISVVSHIFGKELKEIYNKINCKENNKGERLFKKYDSFLKALYFETNPIGIKQVLKLSNIIRSSELRLPLLAPQNISFDLKSSFESLNKEVKQNV